MHFPCIWVGCNLGIDDPADVAGLHWPGYFNYPHRVGGPPAPNCFLSPEKRLKIPI